MLAMHGVSARLAGTAEALVANEGFEQPSPALSHLLLILLAVF